jgi:hypothetical protein
MSILFNRDISVVFTVMSLSCKVNALLELTKVERERSLEAKISVSWSL